MKKTLLLLIFVQLLFANDLQSYILKSKNIDDKQIRILKKNTSFNKINSELSKKTTQIYANNSELSSYVSSQEAPSNELPEPKNYFEDTGNFKPFFKKDFFVMFKFINIGYDKWDFEGFSAGYCVSDESCL